MVLYPFPQYMKNVSDSLGDYDDNCCDTGTDRLRFRLYCAHFPCRHALHDPRAALYVSTTQRNYLDSNFSGKPDGKLDELTWGLLMIMMRRREMSRVTAKAKSIHIYIL